MRFTTYLLAALAAVTSASPIAIPVKAEVEKRQVPVGSIITQCTKPGVIALTFDDGPYAFTTEALNTLNAAGFKATFFMNGQNWASIYDYQSVVQRIYNEGHQIGSHTWSHPDLTTLSTSQIQSQMNQLSTAFRNIIGKAPTYMRPPYLSTNGNVLSTLGNMGFKVISASVDTQDWANTNNVQASLNNFNAGLDQGGNIVLAHDVHQTTVQSLLPKMIASLKSRGLKSVPVGECLNDAKANWYKN